MNLTNTPVLVTAVAAAYAPLILHLALIFPRRRPILERRPHLVRWLYAFTLLAVLIFIAFTALVTMMFADPSKEAEVAHQIGHALLVSSKTIAGAGLLLALSIIYVGRREGVVRAFAHRPFRAVFALFAISCVERAQQRRGHGDEEGEDHRRRALRR